MNKYAANIEDVAISEDTIWFFLSDYNALFSKKIGSDYTEFKGSVPWEKQNGVRLYASIKLYDNKLFLIPCSAQNIAIYDIHKNVFSKIEIKRDRIKQNTSYMASVIYKHYLFLFGFKSACIIRVDLRSYDVVYVDEWYTEISKDILDSSAPFFRKQLAIINDMAYIPFWNANYILQINLDTLRCNTYKLGLEKNGYAGICYFENKLFCIPNSEGENIASFKCENNQLLLETKEMISTFRDKVPIHFIGIIEENDGLTAYLISDNKEKAYINGKIKFYCSNFLFVSDGNGYKCVYNKKSAKLAIFIRNTKETKTEYLYIDFLYWYMFKSETNIINIEKDNIDLRNYLGILHLTDIKETKKGQCVGNVIYKAMTKTEN